MPKFVTPDLLARWRRLSAEGTSFVQIGRETGWDQRTVAKHLKSDVRVGEIDRIRQDLLKERLGRHWDMLIEETRQELSRLNSIDPWEYIDRIREPSVVDFTLSGASVTAGQDGTDLVRANAHAIRSGQLLEQHLPHDPLWKLVEQWEQAMARNFHTRRALYRLTSPWLQAATGWSFTEGEDDQGCYWRPEVLDLVYEEGLVKAAGIPRRGFARERCREVADGMVEAGKLVAHAPGEEEQVCTAIEQCIDRLAATEEATLAAAAYRETQHLVSEIGLALDDLRLLTYLPGVCAVCGRVQL